MTQNTRITLCVEDKCLLSSLRFIGNDEVDINVYPCSLLCAFQTQTFIIAPPV